RYTFPLTTVGGQYLAKLPRSSAAVCLLFRSSILTLEASKARKMPGTVLRLASPLNGWEAQTMPVPAALPSEETESIAPGMPLGTVMGLVAKGEVWSNPLTYLNCLSLSFSLHT